MIELFDGWKIDVDSHSYTLKKVMKGKSKDGKEIEREDCRGYYGTLEGALKGLGKELVRDKVKDGSHSLTEAIQAVREARETMEKLLVEKARC